MRWWVKKGDEDKGIGTGGLLPAKFTVESVDSDHAVVVWQGRRIVMNPGDTLTVALPMEVTFTTF